MAIKRLWAIGTILALSAGCAQLRGRHGTVAPTPMPAPIDSTMFRQLVAPPAGRGRNDAAWQAALSTMSPKLNTALDAGAVTGGGITTQGDGVRAVGRLVTSPIPATDAVRGQVEDALLSSGASQPKIDRLLDAMTGLTGGAVESRGFLFRSHSAPRLSPDAVNEAVRAFHDLTTSARPEYLGNPPQEYRATFSTLFELLCAEYESGGASMDLCAAPNYVADQLPPAPVVNQDSIDAAERARAAADSAARAQAAADSARAAADSMAARPVVDTAQVAAPDTAAASAAAEAAAAEAAARAAMTARARALVETAIYFDFDQFTLRENAKTTLDAKLPILRANPEVRIRVEGNADERGSDEYNQALGMRRAEQVRSYLVSKGIDASRIDIASNGEEHPSCSGHDANCWSQNRRDDFVIVAGGSDLRIPM